MYTLIDRCTTAALTQWNAEQRRAESVLEDSPNKRQEYYMKVIRGHTTCTCNSGCDLMKNIPGHTDLLDGSDTDTTVQYMKTL